MRSDSLAPLLVNITGPEKLERHSPLQTVLLFSHSLTSDSETPGTAAHQASLSFTISLSLLKLMSFEYILYDSTNIKSRINKSRGTNSRFVVA